jgi:hypothetical protein
MRNFEFTQVMAPEVGAAVKICTGRESIMVRKRLSDGGGISRVSVIEPLLAWLGGGGGRPPGVVAAGSDWNDEVKSAPYECRREWPRLNVTGR